MRGALQGEDRIPFVRAVEARCQALSPEPYLELSYMSRAFRHCLAHASSHCGGPPDTSLALQRQHECKLQLRSLLANCWADKLALNGDGMTGCPVADPRCWTGHNTCAKLVLTVGAKLMSQTGVGTCNNIQHRPCHGTTDTKLTAPGAGTCAFWHTKMSHGLRNKFGMQKRARVPFWTAPSEVWRMLFYPNYKAKHAKPERTGVGFHEPTVSNFYFQQCLHILFVQIRCSNSAPMDWLIGTVPKAHSSTNRMENFFARESASSICRILWVNSFFVTSGRKACQLLLGLLGTTRKFLLRPGACSPWCGSGPCNASLWQTAAQTATSCCEYPHSGSRWRGIACRRQWCIARR